MKRVVTLLINLILPLALFSQIPGSFIEQCASDAGEDATYLKDFVVTLAAAPESEGKAIIELYESNKLIYSSYVKNTGEEYNPFNFMCNKTGIYHVFISFLDGKKGEAVGILSYVKK